MENLNFRQIEFTGYRFKLNKMQSKAISGLRFGVDVWACTPGFSVFVPPTLQKTRAGRCTCFYGSRYRILSGLTCIFLVSLAGDLVRQIEIFTTSTGTLFLLALHIVSGRCDFDGDSRY